MRRLLLLPSVILAATMLVVTMAAGPASAEASRVAGLPAPDAVSALFLQEYERAAAASCAAEGDRRAQLAYEVGWMLIRARQRELARPWLREAERLGHDRAKPLLAALPAGPGGTPCRAAPRPVSPTPVLAPAKAAELVRRLSPRYDLDPNLVLAVIAVESGFRPDIVSPKNAQGLMQLIPDTAERFDVDDVFDPAENVRGGMQYLAWLLKTFSGDVALALAGYNAGENVVRRYGGIPPYPETQDYVQKVQSRYEWLKQQEALKLAAAAKAAGRKAGRRAAP